jgi:hypothetical protein
MATRKIPLHDATHAQLFRYGREVCNLPFAQSWGADAMIAHLLRVQPDLQTIELDDEDTPTAPPLTQPQSLEAPPKPTQTPEQIDAAAAVAASTGLRNPDFVTIFISADDKKGGDRDVPIGLNGQTMLIPRNRNVAIPKDHYQILEHTIMHVWDTDREGNIIHPAREVKRFNVNKICDGIAPDAAIARVKKRVNPAAMVQAGA